MMSFKPDNYTSVSPYLIVTDAGATIGFLETVFGASVRRSFLDGDGRIMHSEVQLDDSVVMIADAAPSWPAVPAHVHVYMADVDATYARALAAGAESVQEPARKQDEDKRGGVKDRGGTTWWIATRVG